MHINIVCHCTRAAGSICRVRVRGLDQGKRVGSLDLRASVDQRINAALASHRSPMKLQCTVAACHASHIAWHGVPPMYQPHAVVLQQAPWYPMGSV